MGFSLPYEHLIFCCKLWGGKSLELARWCFWKPLTGQVRSSALAEGQPQRELNEDVSEKQIRPLHSVLYRSVFKSWQQGHARDRQGCVHDVLSFGSSLMLLFSYIICKQDLWCLDGVGYSLFTSYSGVVPSPWDMMVDENHCFSPLSGWLHLCLGA